MILMVTWDLQLCCQWRGREEAGGFLSQLTLTTYIRQSLLHKVKKVGKGFTHFHCKLEARCEEVMPVATSALNRLNILISGRRDMIKSEHNGQGEHLCTCSSQELGEVPDDKDTPLCA